MRWLYVGYVASAAAHVALFTGLSRMKPPPPSSEIVAVMMQQPKKKQKPKPPEPPKPIEAPKEALQHPLARKAAAPPPVAAPPPDPVAAAHPALAAMPDFGISLSGGGLPGGGGIAVPMGGGAAPAAAPVARKEKVLGVPAGRAAETAASDDSAGEFVKAKALGSVRPTYTDDARAAGIEGRVRVEVTIDESGSVISAKVISGLGHGLDESAVAAAKRMTFSPATRGGKPVQSTFIIAVRFELGE
ncbi:MAG TPA: energy transducer TonB [Polyangiaceae bacterium]|jgi:protein TonB